MAVDWVFRWIDLFCLWMEVDSTVNVFRNTEESCCIQIDTTAVSVLSWHVLRKIQKEIFIHKVITWIHLHHSSKKSLLSTTEEPADHSTKQIKIHEKFIVTFSQSMLFDFYDSIFLSSIREHQKKISTLKMKQWMWFIVCHKNEAHKISLKMMTKIILRMNRKRKFFFSKPPSFLRFYEISARLDFLRLFYVEKWMSAMNKEKKSQKYMHTKCLW